MNAVPEILGCEISSSMNIDIDAGDVTPQWYDIRTRRYFL